MPVYPGASVHKQRDHHRRVIRRTTLTVLPIRPIEPAQVHLVDRPQDRPHHMIDRHPLRQIRRHQHRLPPITSNEILWHDEMVLNPPDVTPLPDSHGDKQGSGGPMSEPFVEGIAGARSRTGDGGLRQQSMCLKVFGCRGPSAQEGNADEVWRHFRNAWMRHSALGRAVVLLLVRRGASPGLRGQAARGLEELDRNRAR